MYSREEKFLYHVCNNFICSSIQNKNPISVEIYPTSICNHDCVWCYNKEERHNNISSLDISQMRRMLSEMKNSGVVSVQISGGGEPLVYPYIRELLSLVNEFGFEVGLETNGQLLNTIVDLVKDNWKYIRVSLDACNKEDYALTRTVDDKRREHFAGVFDIVIANLSTITDIKHRNGYNVVVGIGYVVHKSNYNVDKMRSLVSFLNSIGVNLVQFRPDINSGLVLNKDDFGCDNLGINVSVVSEYKYQRQHALCYGAMVSMALYYNNKFNICCVRDDISFGNISDTFVDVVSKSKEFLRCFDTINCPNCRFVILNTFVDNLIRLKQDSHVNFL